MKASGSCDLSPEDKRLLNVLEIKLYDISQNIEILGKQLTNNQIKDIVSMSYSIFSQLKTIAQKSGAMFLYNLHKKMQVNSVLICALLTERLDKRLQQQQITCKCQQSNSASSNIIADKVPQSACAQTKKESRIPRLGGIDIYNERHIRGLQAMYNMFPQTQGRAKKKTVRQCKQEFITAVMSQLQDKADVQVQSINDQIKNYIVNFKETSRAFNLFSCETELQEIIDFFKMSELQAINFLNKSPNNNNQYTQDYLNRLSDLQSDIKAKEHQGKGSILQKMSHFVQRLRQQVAQVQRMYQEKNAKLVQYEKSLKKITSSTGTQTYDGYQRRIKQLETQLREQQEKCQILNQIRKEEHNYQDQIHNLNQLLEMKINQNKKTKISKQELEEELAALKKLIRENNDRLASKFQLERKRNKVKQMLIDPFPQQKHQLESPDLNQLQRITLNRQHSQPRNSRRYERAMNTSSENNRVSLDAEKLRMLATIKGEYEVNKQNQNNGGDGSIYGTQSPVAQLVSRQFNNQEPKQSGFKAQFRKTNHNHTSYLKKISEQERQVSFKVCQDPRATEKNFKSSELAPQQIDAMGGRSIEKSRSMVSIEEEESFRRSNRKNTLRQRIDRIATSMKDLEEDDLKKSSKSISKRCIILKDNKEKNIITTMLKLNNFLIQVQYSLQVEPTIERAPRHTVNEPASETRPSFYNSPSFKAKKSQKNLRLNNVTKSKKQLLSKKEFNKILAQKNNISQIRGNITNNSAIEEENDPQIIKHDVSNRKISKADRVSSKNKIQQNKKSKIEEGNNVSDDRKLQKISKATSLRKGNLQKDYNQSDSHLPDPSFSTILKNVANRQQRGPNLAKTEPLAKLSIQQLQFIKEIGKEGSKLREDKKSPSPDYLAKVSALRQAFEKQNLDFQEFQQMIKIISYGQPLQENISHAHDAKISGKTENIQAKKQYEARNDLVTKVPLKKKEQKLIVLEEESVCHRDTILLLSGTEIEHIKSVHAQSGKCTHQPSGNRYCQHIEKYFDIITKIHAVGFQTRIPLRLPIEKIGQTGQQRPKGDNRQYTNQKSTKKSTVPIEKEGEYTFKRSNNQQSSPHPSYLCDMEEKQQRSRMLPIISQTAGNYYKAKSKIAR